MDRFHDKQNDELIELGVASVETMGAQSGLRTDDGGNHYYPMLGAGLADD